MPLIYVPKGKAREYSPYALNIYLACSHRCEYCYAPRCRWQTAEEYFKKPYPRSGIAEKLADELKKGPAPKEQVLLSFIGDVYCDTYDENQATRECLEVLLKHRVPVAILTKGGNRCLRDIDIFKKFGDHIQIGTTLTFDNSADSLQWERGAAVPSERLEVLKTLHDAGIKTFASFEPVIKPMQSLALMKKGLDCIDTYKIGKLNNYKGLDKKIDWTDFLVKSLELLRAKGKSVYIKQDLRKAAPDVFLFESEVSADKHNVK
jgi:DNA repair photolyase